MPVATLLGCLLDEAGVPDVYKSPAQLQVDFVAELMSASTRTDNALLEEAANAGIIVESGGKVRHDSVSMLEDEELLEWRGSLPRSVTPVAPASSPLELPQRVAQQWLVEGIIRSAEPRGSKVRLDLGIALRARAAHRVSVESCRWCWRHVISKKVKERGLHINHLELQAVLLTLDWRLRSTSRAKRFLHLVDSQVSLAVLAKGRTSSRRSLPVTRKIAARVLVGGLVPLYCFVRSALNPADEPSRADQ